jgi:hypothetical protein
VRIARASDVPRHTDRSPPATPRPSAAATPSRTRGPSSPYRAHPQSATGSEASGTHLNPELPHKRGGLAKKFAALPLRRTQHQSPVPHTPECTAIAGDFPIAASSSEVRLEPEPRPREITASDGRADTGIRPRLTPQLPVLAWRCRIARCQRGADCCRMATRHVTSAALRDFTDLPPYNRR